MRLKRWAIPVLSALLSLGVVVGAQAQINSIPAPRPDCGPFGGAAPAGQQFPTAIEPAQPIWCFPQPQAGAPTRLAGVNDWVDTWDNDGASIQSLNTGDYDYRRFDFTQRERGQDRVVTGGFINVNHWMLDIGDVSPYRLSGGVLLSPNKSFTSENGKLVVEADMAAGSDGMGGADAYYEIDISPARVPTGVTVDPLYGYGQFGGVGAIGCRFERAADGGHVVCARYDDTMRDASGTCMTADHTGCPPGPGRVWEAQGVGTGYTASSVQGGYPGFQAIGSTLRSSDFWRICADSTASTPNSLDLYCRDRMRLEMTQDSIDIYVNGGHVYSIQGLYAQNPHNGADNRLGFIDDQTPAYVYFTSWINGGVHHATRWHWDRLAINPHAADGSFAAPSAHPNYCYGRAYNTCPPDAPATAPTAVPTSQAVSTPQPTSTSTATAQPTQTPAPTQTPPPTSTPEATATTTSCEVNVRLGGVEHGWINC